MTYSLGKRKTLIHIKKKANQRLCYCLTFCTCGINYISFLIYFSIEERHKKDLLLHSLHRYGLGNGMTLLAVNKPDQKLLSNYSGLSFFFFKEPHPDIPRSRTHPYPAFLSSGIPADPSCQVVQKTQLHLQLCRNWLRASLRSR